MIDAQLISTLQELGLGESEVLVYRATFTLGTSTVSAIAKEAGTKRSNTYHVLEGLAKQGFVTFFVENKKTYYRAVGMELLEELITDKITRFNKIKTTISEIRQRLQEHNHDVRYENQHITFFNGRTAAFKIWRDMLRLPPGELIYDIEASHILHEQTSKSRSSLQNAIEDEWARFTFRRMEKRIKIKFISTTPVEIGERLRKQYVNRYIEALMIPKELWPHPLEMGAYANKFYVLTYTEKPIGVILEHSDVSSAFKYLFETFWKWCESQKGVHRVTVD